MQELNITTMTKGLPMEIVCHILTLALQEKDAEIKKRDEKIAELQNRLENNVIAEIDVETVREEFGGGGFVSQQEHCLFVEGATDEVIQAAIKEVLQDGDRFWEEWDEPAPQYGKYRHSTSRDSVMEAIRDVIVMKERAADDPY
jgi:hypothetical protein